MSSSANPSSTAPSKRSILHYARAWGENPLPPISLATLIAAQHVRPFRPVPLFLASTLTFSSYLSVFHYKIDAAGLSAAWAGIYLLLAGRRSQPFVKKFSPRGVIRGVTMGMCLAQVVSGGVVWAVGNRAEEAEVREEKARERVERVKREGGG